MVFYLSLRTSANVCPDAVQLTKCIPEFLELRCLCDRIVKAKHEKNKRGLGKYFLNLHYFFEANCSLFELKMFSNFDCRSFLKSAFESFFVGKVSAFYHQ